MTSFNKPTKQQVDKAVSWLSAPHHERYFFDKLENPHWIAPLAKHGFFNYAPAPEKVEGGGVRCHTWPQSRYLVRMAPLAPKEVVEILAEIETENWVVVRDIIRAAEALPAAFTAMLVPRISDLVEQAAWPYEMLGVGEIAARLARENEVDAALDLVKRVFAVDQRRMAKPARQHDDYLYLKALRDSVIPALIPVRSTDLVELLLQWMRNAIEVRKGESREDDDYSYLWRPAIEDHVQNRDYDFVSQLVGCVRDAFELAIRDGHLTLANALQRLDAQEYLLFKRLQLHLIKECAEQDPDLARQTMLDRSLFCDHRRKHEYARLMGKCFSILSEHQQTEWLGWIDAGPEEMEPDFYEGSEDDDLRRQRREYWQFKRLHWIRDHLSGEWRKFYDRMRKEHGKPELADLHVHSSGVRWGNVSAYTAEQLSEMGFETAVDEVARWRPDPEQSPFDRPSVEGLADSFQQYVASDPTPFSSQARLLKGKPAIYVRSFLEAIEAAVKAGKEIDLVAILDLCGWVIDRHVDEATAPTSEDGELVDRDWQWCRDTIADLVQEICKARGDTKRPRCGIQHREKLWGVIKPLVDSPAKSDTLTEDAEKDPRITNWLLALNSPRGEAMHAVFAYADWLAEHHVEDRTKQGPFPGGFNQVPEVRDLLEAQLTRADDHFTARAVLGERLGLVFWLDAEWLRRHAGRIFDLRAFEEDPTKAFGWAAWNVFLYANRPHIEFYRILQDQFSYAVEQAAAVERPSDSRENPFAYLAEHLIVLYARGDFGNNLTEALAVDEGILQRLITKTAEDVRSHALEFAGRCLQHEGDKTPPDAVRRFKELWEYYWGATGADDAKRNPGSQVFGYWFSSGALDAEWSIAQLEQFVEAAPKADPDHLIMERLASICSVDAARSARIVGMLVEGDDEGWRVSSWQDDARAVLSVAVKAGVEAKREAEMVIDRLGRRGFLEFGDLAHEAIER